MTKRIKTTVIVHTKIGTEPSLIEIPMPWLTVCGEHDGVVRYEVTWHAGEGGTLHAYHVDTCCVCGKQGETA